MRFSTNATDVWVNWGLEAVSNGDWLWPLTGHSGVDIYVEDPGLVDSGVRHRWAMSSGNGPTMNKKLGNASTVGFFTGLFNIPPLSGGRPRNFTVYFPLAATVKFARVSALTAHGGENVPVEPLAAPARRVLFYGTSIMNGAAANRPGLAWPQVAERMLGAEGVNLGMSGQGKFQPYYPKSGLLSEIEYDIAILDPHYNVESLPPDELFNRTLAFVSDMLRRKPDKPILLLEGHASPNRPLEWNATAETLRRAYNRLVADGAKNLFYGRGERKFAGRDMATDFEAQSSTVAGVHPTPLGCRSIATYVVGLVEAILNGTAVAAPVPTALTWPKPVHVSAKRTHQYGDVVWFDASSSPAEVAVEGKGFPYEPATDTSFWQRFPDSAAGNVPANIFRLSTAPSGILVRFRTNASTVHVNITRGDPFSLSETGGVGDALPQDDIFATNGREGLDAHIQDASAMNYGKWRWISTEASTSHSEFGRMEIDLSQTTPPPDGWHNITVYLPVWVPVRSLFIGVDRSAGLAALQPFAEGARPVYVWGSSIAQGGITTNAGMTWPANLQRILGTPLLNFGFSGSCGMQLSVAKQLAEASPPPRMFLMDCQPNMQQKSPEEMVNATRAVLAQLRSTLGLDIPIVVLEGHLYTNNWIKPGQQENQLALNAAQHSVVAALQAAGDSQLFYLGAEGKLGPDKAVAMDSTSGIGVHPSPLAHLHMAEYIAKGLIPILQKMQV